MGGWAVGGEVSFLVHWCILYAWGAPHCSALGGLGLIAGAVELVA